MKKIAEKINVQFTNHSMLRNVERIDGKGSKIIKSIEANLDDVRTFIELNTRYDALMMHDSKREVCFVLAFAMRHGEYIISVVTVPPYKENNWAKADTLLWECKH